MKEVFKKGDKVYCVIHGHGVVVDIEENLDFPIRVDFKDESDIGYTTDGRYYAKVNRTLSFTEYTLQGFSQERPIELPEAGELCLFRDYDKECWRGVEFKMYDKTLNCPFVDSSGDGWKQMKRIKILD